MRIKLFIVFLFLCFLVLLFFNFTFLQAEEKEFKPVLPRPQIKIPGLQFRDVIIRDEGGQRYLNIPWIADFISAFFKFFISAIVIIVMVMIMWGGFLWLTAAGSASQITQAKTKIINALVGLIIALGSYLILHTVNPTLVKLKGIEVRWMKPEYLKWADTVDADKDEEKNTIRHHQEGRWVIDAETLKGLPKPLPSKETSITVERFGGSSDGQLTVYYVKKFLGIGITGKPVMQFPVRTGCCSHGNCNNEKCLKAWKETKDTCEENICRGGGGDKNDQITPIGSFKISYKKDCGEQFYIGGGQCGEGVLNYGHKILNFESTRGLHFHGGYIKKGDVLVDKFYCTYGCVRLLNRDLDTLYEYIAEGTPVSIMCKG